MTLNRYKGALMGLAIGDALGGTTEFMKSKEIKSKFGYLTEIVGGGVWQLEPGETTDDTSMTIAVAKGILDNYIDPIESIGKYFLEWENTNPKDIGTTVRNSFNNYRITKDWFESAKITHNIMGGKSAGNGSLMRCVPVALAYYNDYSKMEEITIKQSKMTHYDNVASGTCLLYNTIIIDILNGSDLKESIISNIKATIYEDIINNKPKSSPTPFVKDTFEWVIYDLLNSNSFEEVVQRLANRGDDSDTTAAIAGGLAGLYYGYNKLPEKYVNKIIRKDEIINISEKLYEKRG